MHSHSPTPATITHLDLANTYCLYPLEDSCTQGVARTDETKTKK